MAAHPILAKSESFWTNGTYDLRLQRNWYDERLL